MKFLKSIPRKHIPSPRGFVLPLTLVVCVIILTIATGISVILAKELYFSKLSRLSQFAYYAADTGLMCATAIDDRFVDPETGYGIFPYSNLVTSQMVLDKVNEQREDRGYNPIQLDQIECATSEIFDQAESNITTAPFTRVDDGGNVESGQTTTFNMQMDTGGNTTRCATVIVNKTATYRQIISRGFASCDSVFGFPIERAVVSTSETSGVAVVPPPPPPQPTLNVIITTPGNGTWTVPEGVTSIKIWAIAAGGGGGNAYTFWGTTVAGGGGGAGGVVYREETVTPGEELTYGIGTGGNSNSNGGGTWVAFHYSRGIESVQAYGGGAGVPGYYGDGGGGSGSTGGTGGVPSAGGSGSGGTSYFGGGSGGAINGGNATSPACNVVSGGQANDANGLFAVLTAIGGYPTSSPGANGGCSQPAGGTNATGFGSGGGGGGPHGGQGGAGLYGGGGGGGVSEQETFGWFIGADAGNGGNGAVIISY